MSDFEHQLNSILSSPETMEQIMALANSISSGGTDPGMDAERCEATPTESPAPSPPSSADLSGLLTLLSGPNSPLGNLDPALVQAGLDLVQAYSRSNEEQLALLTALRPFLQEERQAKLDRAVQLARIARVLQTAYRMFRERKEGDAEHV